MTVKLFEGDKRLETLFEAIEKTIYDRGDGLPVPSVIGVIEMVKQSILDNAK